MMLDYDENCFYEEDKMGMTVTSGSVTLKKDDNNLIGISIGGGAPLCPCIYVVQVFDNTPAAKEGTLQSGDEIVAVSGKSTKSKTKVEVAKMIQSVKSEVTINYNKLHADPKQGKTLDIVLKKVKHRIVDNMNSSTADALGLSRAILCNDSLVKKMDELSRNECIYRGLMEHTHRTLKAFFELCHVYKQFGDVFAEIGVREPQPRASEAFTEFGEAHRSIEKHGIRLLKTVRPMLSDLHTYLHKAVPDTKLTVKKYADAKFEYLSYCLKVKEMDDEEYAYQALQEPLYRVETGNYEYRLILRCRQEARVQFAKLRADVLVKLELLDQKHVQDIVFQLQRLVSALAQYHTDCCDALNGTTIFPIEVDLSKSTFHYQDSSQPSPYQDGEEGSESVDEKLADDNDVDIPRDASLSIETSDGQSRTPSCNSHSVQSFNPPTSGDQIIDTLASLNQEFAELGRVELGANAGMSSTLGDLTALGSEVGLDNQHKLDLFSVLQSGMSIAPTQTNGSNIAHPTTTMGPHPAELPKQPLLDLLD
ncbi:PRKCA-binding protein-like isoform X2 [Varroa jacobsoni]|uniref:PRKCA-binding protein n=1 Tax=Varroa destructor TaxID=109461 RepID=A0A7M7KD51_VARDE|nr:PRKCA-binding protein-like isoform X2 [Varroa destructor]XP_022693868.1 PRKCA-binding protein-like isoform X2 [Varroa jacobsoni]